MSEINRRSTSTPTSRLPAKAGAGGDSYSGATIPPTGKGSPSTGSGKAGTGGSSGAGGKSYFSPANVSRDYTSIAPTGVGAGDKSDS